MGFDFFIVDYPVDPESGDEDEAGYFRVTNKSMGPVYSAMASTGALDLEADTPQLPDWPPAGIEAVRANEIRRFVNGSAEGLAPPTDNELEAIEGFNRALERISCVPGPNPSLCPAYKFVSNIGWHVSENEASTIAESLQSMAAELTEAIAAEYSAPVDGLSGLFSEFAKFNLLASKHGGYRVR